MKARAALLRSQPGEWSVEEVDLADPGRGQVLVRFDAAGLCHSDDHIAQGDVPVDIFPYCGGHEGAGVVLETGPDVESLAVGDHIVVSFVAACGRCRPCVAGFQNLCDRGAETLRSGGGMTAGGEPVGLMARLGTFATHQVLREESCVRVDKDLPPEVACLLGCGVPTGWGSAVNAAGVRPGHTVIVMGVGGVGMSAVQGARAAGASAIIVVDPVTSKRAAAPLFGATHAFADIEEATECARSMSDGQGAESAIVTVGVLHSRHIEAGFPAVRKGGTLVVTSMGPLKTEGAPVSLFELAMYQKRIQGALFGMMSPRNAIADLAGLYRTGGLLLDEMITRTYTLDEVNEAYEQVRAGELVRGVIRF